MGCESTLLRCTADTSLGCGRRIEIEPIKSGETGGKLPGRLDRDVCATIAKMAPENRRANAPLAAGKSCAVCGREIAWRRKWERDWERVLYCGDACRRRSKSDAAASEDAALEGAILALLAERGAGKTICPSEAARRVAKSGTRWEPLMEPARAAARRLYAAGKLVVMQGGHTVDPSHAKGPIRLKLL